MTCEYSESLNKINFTFHINLQLDKMIKNYLLALISCAVSFPIASYGFSGEISVASDSALEAATISNSSNPHSIEEAEEADSDELTNFSVLFEKLKSLELPVVNITTVDGEEPTCEIAETPEGCWGQGIKNANKVPSQMQIIVNGETIYDSGEYVKKESGLTVKVRGNTSAYRQKKAYKLKLQKKADLLNRDDKKYKDKDWVLLRTGSCLNTPVGFWMSEIVGQEWTPAHQYVNLCMNGEYRGIYILCEAVSVNSECRIDVDETDGYVIEADPYWWNEDISFPSTILYQAMQFTYKYPDSDDITEEWNEKIRENVHFNESSILNATFDEYYDCESFAKWLLAWDILGNSDFAGGNMYLVKKDDSAKTAMGPIWDFDHAFKTENDWAEIHKNYFYFHRMLKSDNPAFREAYFNLWQDRGEDFIDEIISRIDKFANSKLGSDYDESLILEQKYATTKEERHDANFGNLEYMAGYITDWFQRRKEWLIPTMQNEIEASGISGIEAPFPDADVSYDILGRLIDPETKGLQIRNGKKIIIR